MLFEQNPPKMYTAQEKQRAVEKYADQITYSSRYSGGSAALDAELQCEICLLTCRLSFLSEWIDDQWEYR